MSHQIFSLSDFDYHLPQSLIAQKPADPRDHSRLLIYDRKNRSITDDYFYNISNYLPSGSSLVLNNSKVEKARLLFGKMEIFITRVIDPYTVEAMIRPGKRFRAGTIVTLTGPETETNSGESATKSTTNSGVSPHGNSTNAHFSNMNAHFISPDSSQNNAPETPPVKAQVLHTSEEGLRTLKFNYPVDHPLFEPYRHTPFPPYIKPDEQLSERYQTIYARDEGSKAAPTAGLHFTERVFTDLSKKSVRPVELTLHVGLGTFAPVKSEAIQNHKMHSEWYQITPEAADALRSSGFITAAGTTTARVLESAATHAGPGPNMTVPFRDFHACDRETDIFITPGYKFQSVDALITNFHLPKSTLLMMVAAFIGIDEMHRIYQHAIREKYRFYSFGDAMLLL